MPLELDACQRAAAEMAEKGLRVLAFAQMEKENSTAELGHDDVAEGMTFLGLQGMIDPPALKLLQWFGFVRKPASRSR